MGRTRLVDRRRYQRSVKVTLLGLAANALLAGVKTVSGVLGHSQALVADGIESFADVVSSLVVWRGVVVAAAPADAEHPYGHGKAEPMAAIAVAALLVGAAFWIGIQAIHEILIPHQPPRPWTLLVLLAVIIAKEALFRHVRAAGQALDSSAVGADAVHHRSDAITSFAALTGILIAVLGGPGYESADDLAALLAGGIIAWNALRLLGPAVNELMDASPDAGLTDRIRLAAAATPGARRIEKCLIRKMGGQYFIDMHVEVDPSMTVLEAHGIAHAVKDRVRGDFPMVADVLIHIEPAGAPPEG